MPPLRPARARGRQHALRKETTVAKTISARIDGELVAAQEGQSILEVATACHKRIPTLCYMPGLSAAGACRLCIVELEGSDRLLAACTTPIQDGMSIRTQSAKLALYRRMAVELMLVERSHVCSVCVSNGHCEFQNLLISLGITHSRYSSDGPGFAADMTHPRFILDQNRCVLCTRCVRVCAEVEGAHVWEVSSRGISSHIVCDLNESWGNARNCTGCGKCVQVCPTAALTMREVSVCPPRKDTDRVARLAVRRTESRHSRPGVSS